jgi:hypothetical protein
MTNYKIYSYPQEHRDRANYLSVNERLFPAQVEHILLKEFGYSASRVRIREWRNMELKRTGKYYENPRESKL